MEAQISLGSPSYTLFHTEERIFMEPAYTWERIGGSMLARLMGNR